MDWFTLTLLSVLGTALANIFRKVAMKDDKSDVLASSIIFQLLGAGIIGSVAMIHGFVFPPISSYPLNFLLIAFLWGGATFCLLKAYQYLEASEVTIMVTLQAVVTILSAIFFLGESFTIQRFMGTILLLIAVFVISKTSKKFSFNKGVFYALGYSLFAGLGITNDTYMLSFVDPLSYLAIGFLIPGLFLLLLKPQTISKIQETIHGPLFKKLFLLTFFYAFSAIAFFFALSAGGQASQITPINQAAIILTIILSTIFLNERDHLVRKTICVLLVILGVLLLR